MTIGILTTLGGANIGAVWQACVTSRLFHATVMAISHVCRVRYYGAGNDHAHRQMLERFMEESLDLSGPFLCADDEREWFGRIESAGLHTLVVGSDEVWKFRSRHMDIPPVNGYWPDERLSCRKVSFAASVGGSVAAGLSCEERREIARRLQGFAFVSVRDRHTERYLREIDSSVEMVRTPDPTWAAEPVEKAYPEIAARFIAWRSEQPERRIALCYDGKKDVAALRKANPSWRFVNPSDMGIFTPPELEAGVKVVDMLVTNRMHGMIAAVRNDTPFLAYHLRPKMSELLEDMELNAVLSFAPGYLCRVVEAWPYKRLAAFRKGMAGIVIAHAEKIVNLRMNMD